MKTKIERARERASLACALVAVGYLVFGSVQAQEVLLPAEATPPPEVAAEMMMEEERLGLVKWGPFAIIPRVRSSVYYDDNVGNRSENKEDEFVVAISPELTAVAQDVVDRVGKVFTIDYSPTFLFYTQGVRGDEITHNAAMQGTLLFPKLTLGLSQRFRFMTDPDVDISTRTKREVYRTALTSRYVLGEKSSVEVNLLLDLTDYQEAEYSDRWQVANENWFSYEYSPKLAGGVGITVGYFEIDGSPNQTFEQARLRAIYSVAEKVTLSVSGGAEIRQFRGSGVSDQVSPVWNAHASYRPRMGTTVSLEAFQQIRNSASQGSQGLLRTGGTVTLRQRIYRRLAMTLSGTYYHSDYRRTALGVVATRTDDSFLARLGLETDIGQRWRAGIFYDYHNNHSNEDRYDYERHRVGARVAWSY